MNTRTYSVVIALVVCTVAAGGQTPARKPPGRALVAPPKPALSFSGSARERLEDSNWYPTNKANGTYTFLGSILRASAVYRTRSMESVLELAAPVLLNLPPHSIATAPQGALGQGAIYFGANGANAASLFVKQGYVQLNPGGGHGTNLRLGRFEFSDGVEGPSVNPTVGYLKQNRIAQRLIGPFGYSHVGRSFDGLEFQTSQRKPVLTALYVFPTRGVFDVHGMETLARVQVGYLSAAISFTGKRAAGETRLFAISYRDDRTGTLKTDNRPVVARTADKHAISLQTFGGDYLHTWAVGTGHADALLWVAAQTGAWGAQSHGALAYAAEAGLQPNLPWKPWLRAGYSSASGDGSSANARHGTFIPLLPTPRIYARYPYYTEANLNDAFVQLILRPNPKLVIRSDLHWVRLANKSDLWYQGGGAYNYQTFGYVGRPSGGHTDLGSLLDISFDYQLRKATALTFYLAWSHGGDVQKSIYKSVDSAFGYFEVNKRF